MFLRSIIIELSYDAIKIDIMSHYNFVAYAIRDTISQPIKKIQGKFVSGHVIFIVQ